MDNPIKDKIRAFEQGHEVYVETREGGASDSQLVNPINDIRRAFD